MHTAFHVAISLLATSVAQAGDAWPKLFVTDSAAAYQSVTLYRDGRAEYSSRIKRPDGIEYKFTATTASWRICDGSPSDARPLCISVDVESDDGAPTRAEFRFDYLLLGETLTEFDKMGTQAVLTRARGAQ